MIEKIKGVFLVQGIVDSVVARYQKLSEIQAKELVLIF